MSTVPRLRSSVLALLVLGTGCDRIWQLDTVSLPGERRDGAVDADNTDAPPDARACFGSPAGLFSPCLTEPLSPPLTLGGTIDTSNDSGCRDLIQLATGRPVCAFAAESIAITSQLVVRGSRPLVLIAGTTIVVSAAIEASSTAVRTAAGAQGVAECSTNSGNGGDAANGGGGGAGGSFGYVGGTSQGGGSTGGTSRTAEPVTPLDGVRGGCPGAKGGLGSSGATTRSSGGAGGGAVYLIAGDSISVTASGRINASGAGGGAALGARGGGGGGGSGGFIGLDAPIVVVDGQLIARGGGGGSGGSDMTAGNRGSEPTDATTVTTGGAAASPGSGSGPGYAGCAGPNGTTGSGNTGPIATAGGGGGGGACGYIYVFADSRTINAATSPVVLP